MKTIVLLIAALFLVLPRVSFGDEANFNAYVNSPEGPSETPIDKNLPLNHEHVTNNEPRKNPDEADSKSALQGIPSKWKTCAVDSDCTAGVLDCVSWDPLNKKYLKKLSENLKSCSASVDPGFQPEAACSDKVCKTTEKTTNVSWEEWLTEMRKERTVPEKQIK